MTRTPLTAIAAALTLAPIAAGAQTPVTSPQVERDKVAIERAAQAGGRGGLVAAVETRVTPGRPYSAEAVTESLQVLGDGNRIARKTTVKVFRDNDGRTRREQTALGGGETITIWDPVSSTSFTLDPATKTAFKSGLLAMKTPAGGFGGGRGGRGVPPALAPTTPVGTADAAKTEETRRREKETAARVEMAETSRDASMQMKQVLERAASGGGTTTREDLGQQMIEGIAATGSRSTTVIPAGAIGNLQEIKIISEQWFSPDLEVLVMTRHSDPRVGETVYRLTNIVRAQPDPALFTVPGDYTIRERGVRQPQ